MHGKIRAVNKNKRGRFRRIRGKIKQEQYTEEKRDIDPEIERYNIDDEIKKINNKASNEQNDKNIYSRTTEDDNIDGIIYDNNGNITNNEMGLTRKKKNSRLKPKRGNFFINF